MSVMGALSGVARGIDVLNEKISKLSTWLVLILTLETALSAIVLKVLDIGSNAFLEIRWYMFSAIFLFGAGYALQKNAHVRIDVLVSRFGHRAQAIVDILGTLFFLAPVALLVIWMSWGVFADSFVTREMSSSAGGLLLWPARLMVPVGFGLLLLQGFSELIKRMAFLLGSGPDPYIDDKPSAEEELANQIRAARQTDAEGGL
jgi:TRAP-type mannitol/chloroaromatic compound transport system permease small subunit